jgi:transposase
MDKYTIIKLKEEGFSNREVARQTGIDRKTVAKFWKSYLEDFDRLNAKESTIEVIQERIISKPTYDSSNRYPRKYNDEIDKYIDEILEAEKHKAKVLGPNKQSLTQYQIYQMVKEKGFNIGLTTVSNKLREKRDYAKECFIKQEYHYGDRLEYDFGEVKLVINGLVTHYYIAVLSSPASNFRWAYLYSNANKEAFMDSHVKFFEMVKGVYKEVVYDNMRNVVNKFVGRSEKVLNEDLINMALYYGFKVNVTNCFSGNEKGHVEGSVKFIRNKVFSKDYRFVSEDVAKKHLEDQLILLNKTSEIEQEMKNLKQYKPMLELARISQHLVDKYSFVRIDNNFYSVPDYLVGKEVIIHKYIDKIRIFSNNHEVAAHKKVDGFNLVSVDIQHYLNTFLKKPGALKNSSALKSVPKLKSIYDLYFTTNPKHFIELLNKFRDKEINDVVDELTKIATASDFKCIDQISNSLNDNISVQTKNQITALKDVYKLN